MARLLVKAVDYTHPDPVKDKQGAYKRGDIVVIMPDGHVWGGREGLPTFEQVDMPGVSVSEFTYLATSEEETVDEMLSAAIRKNKTLSRLLSKTRQRKTKTRRRYNMDLSTQQITDKAR